MVSEVKTPAPAGAGAPSAPPAKVSLFQRYLRPMVGVVIVVALMVIGGLTAPAFATLSNLMSVIRAASITGIVALGLTFVTISGNYFSLSVTQTAILSSVVYGWLASTSDFFVAFLVTVVICIVVGAIQGAIVGVRGNAVIVTLAAGAAILGIVLLMTDSVRVRLTAPADGLAVAVGRSTPLGIPMATWAFVILAIVAHLLLQRTTLGRRIILTGANKNTATAAGFDVRLLTIAAFTISAITAGLAGILTVAEFGVADTAQFPGLDINAVAAVLVGGTAIKGGQGSIIQTCIGAVFISLLRNYLQIIGLSTGAQLVFVGGAVVLAVSAYALVKGARR